MLKIVGVLLTPRGTETCFFQKGVPPRINSKNVLLSKSHKVVFSNMKYENIIIGKTHRAP